MGQKQLNYTNGVWVATDTRTLAEAQADALNRLAQYYSALIAQGFIYSGNTFAIDGENGVAIYGVVLFALASLQGGGPAWDATLKWPTITGTMVTVATAAVAIAFGGALTKYLAQMVHNNGTLTADILALSNNTSCDAFDVTVGWPAN